ncbi:FecR family protein [Parapedobacter koreensis]|uniref:FecR family protein n=1 Tax=Parapedobacter koreensis TaxID=332977 RepID=A0A1H7PUG9_9SPHI|nr:FecR domain-containing protein [Parapedobacter koreensis]SEL39118.1 FecR family protein [Parapedobacter koreensis]
MDNYCLQDLLTRYFDNDISRTDCERLLKYLDEGDPSVISAAIDEVLERKKTLPVFSRQRQVHTYNQLLAVIQQQQADMRRQTVSRPLSVFLSPWVWAAAMVAAVFSIGLILYFNSSNNTPPVTAMETVTDDILLPDHNQAILTLADGRTVVLSDTSEGILAMDLGVRIRMAADGSILYEPIPAKGGNENPVYNTFSTPKGHTHRLQLPDGTKVWLNTASSLHYPVAFIGAVRNVQLAGEAYFEVEPDALKPFIVEANGSTVKVLGTHFNVSAYADQQETTTTLVEGAVDVFKNGKSVALKPGQQAVVDELTGAIRQSQVNVHSVIAWKEGYFRFDNESISDIINKISRWYDIDSVAYHRQFTDRFTGTFQRSKQVSQLFSNLEKLAPIKFEIKEGRVVIMK